MKENKESKDRQYKQFKKQIEKLELPPKLYEAIIKAWCESRRY